MIEEKATEGNKAIFRRYVEEVWVSEGLGAVDEIFAEKYLSHQSDGSMLERGPEDVKKFVKEYRSAFTDIEDTVEDMISEGDKVATRWSLATTHSGDFRGVAPTGNRFTMRGVGIFRFEGGKVVESWDVIDQLDMLRQLGKITEA